MPEQSTTLRDMINAELENGSSLRKLAERAIDPITGKRASASLFFDIVNSKLDRAPRDYHVRAIAVALRAPYEQVRQLAIAQWLPAADEEDPERERQEQLAELKRLRDQADAAIAKLEQNDGPGGRRAG
jgi:hypothetical protein